MIAKKRDKTRRALKEISLNYFYPKGITKLTLQFTS